MLTDKDTIIYVEGTAGSIRWHDRQLERALRAHGYEARLFSHQWHVSRPPAYICWNRREYELVHLGAQSLADWIAALRAESPDGRLHLAAQSAGSEVIRLALELLPEGVTVDNVVLIAPSTSSSAPMERALASVRGKVFYTASVVDAMMSVGTLLACTTDLKKTFAAGFAGFRPREGLDEESLARYRDKLVEVRWKPRYALLGWLGDHLSGWSEPFLERFTLPMLAGRDPLGTV